MAGWEYELLFDVEDMESMTPLEAAARMEAGDRWKTEETGVRRGRMGYRTRTTKAGPRLEAEIYPIFGKEQEETAREAKQRITPERIRKHNDEQARRKLVRLMDANFGRGDYSLTLTYEGEAPGWERAQRDTANFIERVKRLRRKLGLPEMKYIYALEWSAGDREKRTHCHLVTQGDIPREYLEQMWNQEGRNRVRRGFVNCDELQPTKEGLEALARYLYNQNPGLPRQKGQRKYSCSRNLRKPKTRISDTKVTGGKVKKLAHVFGTDESEARRIMERLYPGYEYVRGSAKGSDVITDGVYIRVLMRKRE